MPSLHPADGWTEVAPVDVANASAILIDRSEKRGATDAALIASVLAGLAMLIVADIPVWWAVVAGVVIRFAAIGGAALLSAIRDERRDAKARRAVRQ
jgi:hypothetical protein